MATLKIIPVAGVSDALEKALRYRLLNEPAEAESICRDILAIEPGNQDAVVPLLLSITDQFETDFTTALDAAKEVLTLIQGEYEQAYYEGIIFERWGRTQYAKHLPGKFVTGWIREAMRCYEAAEKLSEQDNPDAILRWNTCVRFLEKQADVEEIKVSSTSDVEAAYGDDMPLR